MRDKVILVKIEADEQIGIEEKLKAHSLGYCIELFGAFIC